VIFRQLDERFPGSKFILTVRHPDAWIKSIVEHFGCKDTPMRQWIYGVGHPQGNEVIYLRRYEEHNRDVLAHFRDRPDDLLVMDITAGESWDTLCPFLGHGIPQPRFPLRTPPLIGLESMESVESGRVARSSCTFATLVRRTGKVQPGCP